MDKNRWRRAFADRYGYFPGAPGEGGGGDDGGGGGAAVEDFDG